MRKIRTLLKWSLLAPLFLSVTLAHAENDEENCAAIFDDTKDQYALGMFPIGTPGLTALTPKAWEVCLAANQIDSRCAFIGVDGLDYEVIGHVFTYQPLHVWYAHVSVEDLAARYQPAPPLIAGLKFGDTRATVLQKLSQLPKDFPAWHNQEAADPARPSLATNACIRSSFGERWSYHLYFDDNDRLGTASAENIGYFVNT